MYINPFWAGVLAVIVVETISVFVIGVISMSKKK